MKIKGVEMTPMFAIARRKTNSIDGLAFWGGPSPSERDMLNIPGNDREDFIIRFDGEPGSGEILTHALLWRWNDIVGSWQRYSPRVLNKKNDQQFIKDLGKDAVYIGRGSKWGNPFIIPKDGDRDEVILKYAEKLIEDTSLLGSIGELTGKYLVCYCAPEACHGDILIELANPIIEEQTDQWEFKRYTPEPEDFDIRSNEWNRYFKTLMNTDAKYSGEEDVNIFNAGFTRGLAWGIHKTTRTFDHITRAQADRYHYGHPILERDDDDDIPF
jgi:hypothetical protein